MDAVVAEAGWASRLRVEDSSPSETRDEDRGESGRRCEAESGEARRKEQKMMGEGGGRRDEGGGRREVRETRGAMGKAAHGYSSGTSDGAIAPPTWSFSMIAAVPWIGVFSQVNMDTSRWQRVSAAFRAVTPQFGAVCFLGSALQAELARADARQKPHP
ncbi:hypothetical protein JCM24511_00529 [Saitozyma sp. JCM 24511]|nr:hypothetical protein JCM24511_00529 [Saitozyma sp. JCM 24511]